MITKKYLEKTYDTLSQEQKLKLALYNDFGEKAQSIFDWLNHSASNQQDDKPVIDKSETIYPDGVYYLYKDGSKELFDSAGQNKPQKPVKYIGVRMGKRSIAVSLKDYSEWNLTNNESGIEHDDYIDDIDDAVADWNGKSNTKHIKQAGTDIELEANEWIPSVAELYLIYLNKRSINLAIRFSEGGCIEDGWYWSSTEKSKEFAYNINMHDGAITLDVKNLVEIYVRTVAAFH